MAVDLDDSETLLTQLEQSPESSQLYYVKLERLIAWTMDETYRLARAGTDNDYKMRVIAIEYRARLLLERLGKQSVN